MITSSSAGCDPYPETCSEVVKKQRSLASLSEMLSFVASPTTFVQRPPRFLACRRAPQRWATSARMIPLSTGVNMEVFENPPYSISSSSVAEDDVMSDTIGEKPPLIFIHGSLHAAWCFHLFQDFFVRNGFQTFAVSLRQAGGTVVPDPNTVPTVEDHISDLRALLNQLKLPRAPVIIGHSNGGFIAQKWIEQELSFEPFRFILLCSVPPSGTSALAWRITRQIGLWKSIRITVGFIYRTCTTNLDLCREMFFSRKDSEGFSDNLEGDERLLEYMGQMESTLQILSTKSLKKHVKGTGTMKGKVFVVGAELDNLVDLQALEETADLWGAQFHVMDNAPHDVMLYSKWEGVAKLVLHWIHGEIQNAQDLA